MDVFTVPEVPLRRAAIVLQDILDRGTVMFDLRKRIVDEFNDYIRAFITIKDPGIEQYLSQELKRGVLWPQPLLGLNPTFQMAERVEDIPDLDHRCGTIFRRGKSETDASGLPIRLYKHQVRAIERALQGRNYVLTTGTGSGKSLSYILPIVDTILKNGPGKGVQAVVVYPMNALANSQERELAKFLDYGAEAGKIRVKRYTGQEAQAEKDEIAANPPDIILTNYVMLELMLTRPFEQRLISAMSNLRFVVLDELHTYRGRQGADVALLVRRLRERTGAKNLQFVGTSATMSTSGTPTEKRRAVAEVASRLFGATFEEADIIGETLEPYSTERDIPAEELAASLATVPNSPQEFQSHPLTIWLEHVIALSKDSEGTITRAVPVPLFGPGSTAERLADVCGVSLETAESTLQSHLLLSERLFADVPGPRPFVFRLHQFMSPGNGIYATLGNSIQRHLTLESQKAHPDNPDHLYYQLAFCRNCGQHYFIVMRDTGQAAQRLFKPAMFREEPITEDERAGYLYIPEPGETVDPVRLIPESWYDPKSKSGALRRNRRDQVPVRFDLGQDGHPGSAVETWFLPARLPFCMNPDCDVEFIAQESDSTRLAVLGMQGRSTATSTLSISALSYLKETQAPAQKLLSFTDNRQDASLQAGHLNDFVQITLLRAAIHAAARQAGADGLAFDEVAQKVTGCLGLKQEEFARQVSDLPTQIRERQRALHDVLGYRIYRDLRRGWRINAPNLEQVQLISIEYPDLDFVCNDEKRWQGGTEILAAASPDHRKRILHFLLESMRRKLIIHTDYLNSEEQYRLRQRSNQFLKEPWALGEEESQRLYSAAHCWLQSTPATEEGADLILSAQSSLARHIMNRVPLVCDRKQLREEIEPVIRQIVSVAVEAGLIKQVEIGSQVAYQLAASAFVWVATEPDDVHKRGKNSFFQKLYTSSALQLKGIHAREHTAQVTADEREKRESMFREGTLPIMFCSPTMELGVDISDLSVVNMRNVPPTPANYAQRSGRAGRSGQAALVFTYCTAGSPHDQYYFRRQQDMVAGAVAPPRLDLSNEDLVRAHVHAIWLSLAGYDLGKSLKDTVLDVVGETPTLAIQEALQDKLSSIVLKDAAKAAGQKMLDAIGPDLKHASWFTDRWLSDTVDQIPIALNAACERWRDLFRSAHSQAERQSAILRDASKDETDRGRAQELRRQAERQLVLLTDSGSEFQSDFYTYRYFASEGFLPGYNFPRLPLTAYIPGRNSNDEYLSRPRFLAIAEFGPGALVYHEGSRYRVDRVLMPPGSVLDNGRVAKSTVKLCQTCGYLHDGENAETADICDACHQPLGTDTIISAMFRLQGVSLQRTESITCDEEERMRKGYDIRTGIKFSGLPGAHNVSSTSLVMPEDLETQLAELTYAPNATISRINVGWKRRKNPFDFGFSLDVEKARWVKDKKAGEVQVSDEADAPPGRTEKLVPYVDDRRNGLILTWKASQLTAAQFFSLKAALKTAIQIVYQLEDNELAAECLPSSLNPKSILFYESAEGGAGVLRRVADDPAAIGAIARAALELCHFDAETLEDLGKAQNASQRCSAACYNCIMSYGNQTDHDLLDRFQILELLGLLKDCKPVISRTQQPRGDRLEYLLSQTGSNLERDWLQLIEANNLALPDYSQYRIEECGTVPDFVYLRGGMRLAVYIDGPPHDYPSRQYRDQEQDMALLTHGWLVQRFHYTADWLDLLKQYPGTYGEIK